MVSEYVNFGYIGFDHGGKPKVSRLFYYFSAEYLAALRRG
jgi:hypothetical protein